MGGRKNARKRTVAVRRPDGVVYSIRPGEGRIWSGGGDDRLNFRLSRRLPDTALNGPEEVALLFGSISAIGKIRFHENGACEYVKLSKPVLIETPAGGIFADEIYFYKNGAVQYVDFSRPAVLSSALGSLKAVKTVCFLDDGRLLYARLAAPADVMTPAGPVTAAADEVLYLNDRGGVCEVRLAGPAKINTPIGPVTAAGWLYFYFEEDKIWVVHPADPAYIEIDGRRAVCVSAVEFDRDGKIKRVD